MQRNPTKNTRGPNVHEKKFQRWLKEQPCIVSGKAGPSIVHHCEGATFKHNKVLIGHWFCIPLCKRVDDFITFGNRKKFREMFETQSSLWNIVYEKYDQASVIPIEVYCAIIDWGK